MKKRKTIFLYFLGILLFLTASLFSLSFLMKENVREEKFVKVLEANDISFLLNTKEYVQIEDFLKEIEIPSEKVNELLNQKETKTFLAHYTYQWFSSWIYKSPQQVIFKDDLIRLVETMDIPKKEEVKSLIQKHTFHVPTVEEVMMHLSIDDSVRNGYLFLFSLIHFVTSQTFLLFSIIFFFILVILIEVVGKKDYMFFKIYQFSIICYIFTFILLEIILGTVVKEYFMNLWQKANTFINYFINSIRMNVWLFFILAIILYWIVSYLEKRKNGS